MEIVKAFFMVPTLNFPMGTRKDRAQYLTLVGVVEGVVGASRGE